MPSIKLSYTKSKILYSFVVIALLVYNSTIWAQSPNVLWQKTYGGSDGDLLYDIIRDTFGNYLLSGYSLSPISGNCTENTYGLTDYWVVKVDGDGTIVWQNKYGGNDSDNLYTAIETSDGGFLLLGYSNSTISGDKTAPNYGGDDIWVVKVDSTGTVLWDKTYGGDSLEFINCGIATSYGYILAGYSYSGISGNKTLANLGSADIWLVGIDFSGAILWQKAYGGNAGEIPIHIVHSSDGNIVICGSSSSSNSGTFAQNSYGFSDYWVLKLDINGNLLWQNNYGGSGYESAQKILETANGDFIITGYSNSPTSGTKTSTNYGGNDVWVVKIDSNGNLLWDNSYGGDQDDASYNGVIVDGGYFLTGSSLSDVSGNKTTPANGSYDFWGLKIDDNGAILWQKGIGGTLSDGCNSIVQNPDGSFLLAGSSSSPVSGTKTVASYGDTDYWLVKLEAEDLHTPAFLSETTFYPNPAKDYFYIDFANNFNTIEIEVYNTLGQLVKTKKVYNQNRLRFDCNDITDGIFLITIKTDGKIAQYKLIKE